MADVQGESGISWLGFNQRRNSDLMGSSKEHHVAWEKYKKMFGGYPPVFGYEEGDILPAIIKALETKKPMPGMDEIIEKNLGITDEDRAAGKGIKL